MMQARSRPVSSRTATGFRPTSQDAGRISRGQSRSRGRRRRPPLRRCASLPASRSRISARRWTCCGFASPSGAMTASRRSAASRPAWCSSCSTAAIIGNAPMSFPKAASTGCAPRASRPFARRSSASISAFADRVDEITSWDDVKLLTVTVDRLKRWYRPGLLCIGDAAHAMSPIGGVGINLAIQDAVAAANILWQPLRQGRCRSRTSPRCKQRREWPTKMMQARSALRAEAHHQQRARP